MGGQVRNCGKQQGIGRCREANKSITLSGVQIELGQSVGRQQRNNERQIRENLGVSLGLGKGIQENSRKYTKGDDIGQGIQLFAHITLNLQQSGYKSIKKIEGCRQNHKIGSIKWLSIQNPDDSQYSRKEVQKGDEVRKLCF
jgi:hypothetical protein